ncbi:MAG TPA: TraB/GumN family protein [Bacteroidia bacterium]|nr:TraB/GumN family protein [Bacteroidia bacterium]
MKLSFFLFLTALSFSCLAQNNFLLWEISGNGLKAPSYLFGTYHLINSTFIDSMPLIQKKFDACSTVAGEILMDAGTLAKVSESAIMKDSSLSQLMTKEEYDLTAAYLKETTGMNLSLFDKMKPVVISTLFYTALIPKNNPGKPMDIYFQEMAKKQGKNLVGLETVEDQIAVLFNSMPLKRQARMLVETVKDKDKNLKEMIRMDHCYRNQDLDCLGQSISEDESYSPDEMAQLVELRNQRWIAELPAMMQEKSCFIAVGAGHLPGEKGLLEMLRRKGYQVNGLKMN